MKRKHVKSFLNKISDEKHIYSDKDFAIIKKLSKNKDKLVRSDIADILAFSEADISEGILYDMTFDKDWFVRASAVDSIGNGKEIKTFDRIYYVMQFDRNPIVRSYAVLSQYDIFKNMEDKIYLKEEYINKLIGCMNKEASSEVRVSYYEVLCYMGEKRYFVKILNSLKTRVKARAFDSVWGLLHSIERLFDEGVIEKKEIADSLEPLIEFLPKQQKKLLFNMLYGTNG